MSLLGSRHSRRRIQFLFLVSLAIGGSLVIMNVAPKSYPGAEQVAFLPLLLTAWIGGVQYRHQFGGRRWWWRTGSAMSAAALLGGILALIVLMPWSNWPGLSVVAHWLLVITGAALAWGVVVVIFALLDGRRWTRMIRSVSREFPRYHRRGTAHR